MRKYSKKLQRRLCLFLSVFHMILTIATTVIFTTNINYNYEQMARQHMDHLYENYVQRFSLLEENLLSLASDSRIKASVTEYPKININNILTDSILSYNHIHSLSVYGNNAGKLTFVKNAGGILLASDSLQEMVNTYPLQSNETLWRIFLLPYSHLYFTCLMPIYQDEKIAGYLVALIDLHSFMNTVTYADNPAFTTKLIAIGGSDLRWMDSGSSLPPQNVIDYSKPVDFSSINDYVFSIRPLLNTGENLIQIMTLDITYIIRQIIINGIIFFCIGYCLIYLAVYTFTSHLVKPLEKLNESLKQVNP